jgi:hypothetical protein
VARLLQVGVCMSFRPGNGLQPRKVLRRNFATMKPISLLLVSVALLLAAVRSSRSGLDAGVAPIYLLPALLAPPLIFFGAFLHALWTSRVPKSAADAQVAAACAAEGSSTHTPKDKST